MSMNLRLSKSNLGIFSTTILFSYERCSKMNFLLVSWVHCVIILRTITKHECSSKLGVRFELLFERVKLKL